MDLTKKIIAKIKITRISDALANIDVEMPIWTNKENNGKITIVLGLFGGLTTFADNENEVDAAIGEALKIFFDAAHISGKGAHKELEALGWQTKKNSIRFRVGSSKQFDIPNAPALAGMAKTGKRMDISLQASAC